MTDRSVLSDEEVSTTYLRQDSVERGVHFLTNPLFLASSVFVKKPARGCGFASKILR